MSARLAACIVAAVLTLGVAGGCKAREGQKVIGYSGKTNNFTKAPETGRYSLRGARGENLTYYVEKGERIGFRKSDTDRVEAYAGDNAPVELDRSSARTAYWKFTKADPK